MKHSYSQKVKAAIIIILIAAVSLCGCKKGSDTVKQEKSSESDASAKEAIEIMETQNESETETEPENREEEVKYSLPDEAVSSGVILFDDRVYFIGNNELSVMDIASGESKTIWKGDYEYNSLAAYGIGRGLLLYDKIYFYSEYYDDVKREVHKKLQVIGLDGENYRIADEYVAETYCSGDMYYRDGMLYVDGNGINDCYVIDEEGNIKKTVERASIAEYESNTGLRLYAEYIHDSGKVRYSLTEAFKYKKYVVTIDGEDTLYDMTSGRETGLGGDVVASNDDVLLIRGMQNEKYIYGTINLKSGEYTYLSKDEEDKHFVAIDDKFAYFYIPDGKGSAVFYKLNITNGKETEIYTYEANDSRINNSAMDYFAVVKKGDYLFLSESHDYALYLEAVNIENGDVVCSSESFYDSGIGKLGKLIIKSDEIRDASGEVTVSAYSEVLNLSDKYAGADKINEVLNKQGNVVFELFDERKQKSEESEEDSYVINYSFSIGMGNKLYFKDKLLSFYLDGYDYWGGAHGMPYRCPYVFNVDTGKQYTLADLVTIEEDEMIDIVTEAFLKEITESENSMFWTREENEPYIRANFGMDYKYFYLTEEGLAIFFEPYEIAAFAQGFPEVIIPYETLGIDLKAIAAEDDCEEYEEATE